MNGQIRDLASATTQLRTLAVTLNSEVDRFTLEDETGNGYPPKSSPETLNL
jgi:hypothetical protein